jgi:hypothetical protein
MENDLQQKNIVITNVETNQYGYKVTDEKGLKYNITEKKKDGNTSVAFKTLSEMPKLGLGLNKCFKFAVVKNSQGGESRYVRIISEPEEAGQPSAYVSPKMEHAKPVLIETRDFHGEAWGKCKHAYLLIAFQQGTKLKEAEVIAEEWADASMRKLVKPMDAYPEVSDEDIKTIPF